MKEEPTEDMSVDDSVLAPRQTDDNSNISNSSESRPKQEESSLGIPDLKGEDSSTLPDISDADDSNPSLFDNDTSAAAKSPASVGAAVSQGFMSASASSASDLDGLIIGGENSIISTDSMFNNEHSNTSLPSGD